MSVLAKIQVAEESAPQNCHASSGLLSKRQACSFGALRRTIIAMSTELEKVMSRVSELVVRYRTQCLWFLRSDYYPTTVADARQVLDYIQRYGDLEAFRQAGRLKQWLSRNSSAASAA